MSNAARFSRLVTSPIKHHVYVSRSSDVAVNLTIEHYLFQRSHPASTVLFLYVNKPCIVIGTNQNPWFEVNHALIRRNPASLDTSQQHDGPPPKVQDEIKVIRRHSGGGTVFHDLGNVNFSVIFPLLDKIVNYKHAEMVVRAIRKTNSRARVNHRHDIVLDPGPLLEKSDWPDPEDARRTAYAFGSGELEPRKISGSAGKASGPRGLHHGTCLLASSNLSNISEYLRSPAAPFLFTKATPSTPSPVANIISQDTPRPTTSMLQQQIINAFIEMYNIDMTNLSLPQESDTALQSNENCATGTLDDTLLEIPEIRSGCSEIQSPEWLYEQKREFTLSSHPHNAHPPLPTWFPPSARVHLVIKSGLITSSSISLSPSPSTASSEAEKFDAVLKNTRIIKLDSFRRLLSESVSFDGDKQRQDIYRVGAWLDWILLGREIDL
ncbi:MAG: hypothetical protein L6R42_008612 [Xanthoria sp. 1 TBL-2021]|nr:MAG: hypothetical protein L6R42_008612 [Xanthoria sp. 1 TBL-2021]